MGGRNSKGRHQHEQIERLQRDAADNARRWQAQMQAQQAMTDQMNAQNALLKNQLDSLQKQLAESEKRTQELIALAEKPIQERAEKVKFVNDLKIPIVRNSTILLVGNKGAGKSTFLWLRGEGPKPSPTSADGTTKLVIGNKYTDTIGLTWSMDSLYKLLVLLIYHGIPKDVVVVSMNDRIGQSTGLLASLSVLNPVLVIPRPANLWDELDSGEIVLEKDRNGILRIAGNNKEKALKKIYDYRAYEVIRTLSLGKTVTHEDDLEEIMENRQRSGVRPFDAIVSMLGSAFVAPDSYHPGHGNHHMEMLFRFIYLYEKNYKNRVNDKGENEGELRFLNDCQITEFT